MHATHEKIARKNPKLVQFLDRFATYNGSNPYKASGILSMIPHFEHGFGTFYPVGGMHAITQAIHQLGEKLGVKYHFNTTIERIITEKNKITGIRVESGELSIETNEMHPSLSTLNSPISTFHPFDAVVSNMDVYYTYSKLLNDKKTADTINKQERSSSALIFYWGINRTFDNLGLHNIFFSENYAAEFDHLAKGEISPDPTIYINITSKLTPSDAPAKL